MCCAAGVRWRALDDGSAASARQAAPAAGQGPDEEPVDDICVYVDADGTGPSSLDQVRMYYSADGPCAGGPCMWHTIAAIAAVTWAAGGRGRDRVVVVARDEAMGWVVGFAHLALEAYDSSARKWAPREQAAGPGLLLRPHATMVAVRSSHRRRGVARRLLQACEGIALAWGCHELVLEARARNAAARALYGSLGYAEEHAECACAVARWGACLVVLPDTEVRMCKALR
mmetsp:Transcript_21801/g.73354  ORF Transcript_21801/g.73354 Transcript_21801/m.73354 type:complete len:229 (+) Transcript_21801:152-838(+)|eukprot:CAMPEP_0206012486 /NCGR_PEP_ID=MMETSP1464-20131121/14929_1 /ASSEMBLY_ACC=CAM_ASM_001124 /TAXON_ID=119497 /ORGANISM="Exanthemachrysis gayraliae, Strain RCC1523" /LENGTH=228 /DNA_ID=CAMNT_0053386169 /DNA_START=57 /DNA_END=743 /DNA_ORIENTATION=+